MPTHNTYRYTLGVVFAGVGDDTSETGGRAWAFGPAPTGTSTYEWMGNHLVRLPESIDTSVNPLSGDYNTSSFDFELALNDAVATTFLYQSTDAAYKLGSNGLTTLTQTAIKVVDLAGADATGLANTAVWVADECILLGTHSGAGVYSSCTRGFWGTSAAIVPANVFVHTAPNYWRHRGVKLILHDRDTDAERTLWRGWVDAMDTGADGTTLTVSCNEVLASLRDAQVNRRVDIAPIIPFGLLLPSTQTDGVNWIGRDKFGHTGAVRKATGTSYTAWLQVNDGLFAATYSVTTSQMRYGYSAAGAVLGSMRNLKERERVEKINEVFFVDSSRSAAQSSTGALTLPFHPLEIAMALLTSTRSETVDVGSESWDALNGNFALGVPLDYFDTSAIADVISASRGVKVARLLLGWDGETVDVMEVIREKLLKPYGFYFAITEDGLISFRRLELFNITDYTSAAALTVSALPTQLQWSAARANAVQQVVAEIGGLPWRDPDITTVTGRDNTRTDSLRSGIFGELSTYTLDMSTQDSAEQVQGALIDRLKYAYWAMPRLTITVGNSTVTGATYDMGAVVVPTIDTQSPWLVDNDGTRSTTTGQVDAQHAGIIVGRTLVLENMTYTLTLLLTNYRQGGATYLRAPSGVLNGAPSGANVTLESNAFHAAGRDATRFEAGQMVEFWSPDGTLVETGHQILSVESTLNNVITLFASPTLAADGDILRLSDYDNKGVATDSFNYLSDSTGTLGAAADSGRRWA